MNFLAAPSKLFASLIAIALAFGAAGFSTTANAAKSLPEVSPEGLKLIPNTKLSAVYMREGADFSGYDKVAILDCYVAFRKNWKRDQNTGQTPFKVSDSDIEKIKTELAAEFKKVFTQELTAKGTTVVTTGGTGVLVLRPAIINLDIAAPDTMQPGRTRSFSASAGAATLYLEVLDGVTGDLLARAIDPQEAADYGRAQVRNGVTNRADADRMLKMWADTLASYLQRVRGGGASSQ